MTSVEHDQTAAARRIGIGMSLGVVVLLATATVGLGADPGPSITPGTTPDPDAIEVVASGPFGHVPGIGSATVPDPASLPVLDAWARGVTMGVAPSAGALSDWTAGALAEPALDPTVALELGTGVAPAYIHLPVTGLFLVRFDATLLPEAGDPIHGSWWWRIAVPDRELPEGQGMVPPPRIRLGSGARVRRLEAGSFCFGGTCGDIGATSPPRLLPTLRTLPGAPLAVTLSDGSGMTGWWIDATPVGGTDADTLTLGEDQDAPSTTRVVVPAPGEGSWVIVVFVTFDRGRGSSAGYGRLILRPPAAEIAP